MLAWATHQGAGRDGSRTLCATMVGQRLEGLLTAASRASLRFTFLFLFQQETPTKSLSGPGMLREGRPQPSLARGGARTGSEVSPAPGEIKGTQAGVRPVSGALRQPWSAQGTAELASLPCTLERTPHSPDRYRFLWKQEKNLFFG